MTTNPHNEARTLARELNNVNGSLDTLMGRLMILTDDLAVAEVRPARRAEEAIGEARRALSRAAAELAHVPFAAVDAAIIAARKEGRR